MKPIFSVRNRFYERKDDTCTVYPFGEAGKAVARWFIALFHRIQYLLSALALLFVAVLFVDASKLQALQALHTQDLCDSLRKN